MTQFGFTPRAAGPLARKLAAMANGQHVADRRPAERVAPALPTPTVNVPAPTAGPTPEPRPVVVRLARQLKAAEAAISDLQCKVSDLEERLARHEAAAPPRPAPKVYIPQIIRVVANHYGVEVDDILSVRRTGNIIFPRHVAMYLSRKLTPCSLPEIGRRFGGRDHTTVLHAISHIERVIAEFPDSVAEVEMLRRQIAPEDRP